MRFSIALCTVLLSGFAAAATVQQRDPVDPTNPQDLINCPPDGGADSCHHETQCGRIRINYGYQVLGHYIWYNYNPDDVPDGKTVEIDNQATC
ncbi:hypothetical protein BD626DRAFT_632025 [Schizophyllum amplum]|uniref:Chitin-binding type-4 domain-containing protein n=1 Tax=Schizophyllum amplum TaxID=97359 RepID=A0A550C8W4_9AGAR|nr:hypothetical protein BD626DRAFT_632025 [Auriculariopsis ampla]